MHEKNSIHFEMLGSFSYGDNGMTLKTGKKALSFLQYLIVNHDRSISSDELIDQFWTENNSSSPSNALRNMLFKVRNLLEDMFPDKKDLLQTFPGYYAWNKNVNIKLA